MNVCFKCGHSWEQRNSFPPKMCPKCKTRKWNPEIADGRLETIRESLIVLKDSFDKSETANPFVMNVVFELELIASDKSSIDKIPLIIELIYLCRDIIPLKGSSNRGIYHTLTRLAEAHIYDLSVVLRGDSKSPYKESDLEDKLIKNWDSIDVLDCYNFVDNQYKLPDLDLIDVLAKEKTTGRDVIIELKKGNKNGYKQLRAYSYFFKNPILVNISEYPVISKKEGIVYISLGQEYVEIIGKSPILELMDNSKG